MTPPDALHVLGVVLIILSLVFVGLACTWNRCGRPLGWFGLCTSMFCAVLDGVWGLLILTGGVTA